MNIEGYNMNLFKIEQRQRRLINTDPQRRCYNGCHAKSEMLWTQWATLQFDVSEEVIEERLQWWRELNDYAISQRGESARKEFRVVPQDENLEDQTP
jgi:hypothetical protein